MMETRQDRAVGIIPVYKTDSGGFLFCLVQHADGHWGFPKGHVEAGESDEQAAQRELLEETGIADVAIVQDKIYSTHYEFEHGDVLVQKTNTYFLGFVHSIQDATLDHFKHEIPATRWLPYQEAKETITFSESKNLLDEVWRYVGERLE